MGSTSEHLNLRFSKTNAKMGKMLLHLHHSISFTRQILADLQNSSAPTTVNQVNYFFDLCFEKPLQEPFLMTPRPGFDKVSLIKIDKTELYIRVSHLSLIGTHTKCLQLQWQKTSKVKHQRYSQNKIANNNIGKSNHVSFSRHKDGC